MGVPQEPGMFGLPNAPRAAGVSGFGGTNGFRGAGSAGLGATTCAASAPAGKAGAISDLRPDPRHAPTPITPTQGPSCLCPPLPFPSFRFNLGRAAAKNPPTRCPRFLNPPRPSALTLPFLPLALQPQPSPPSSLWLRAQESRSGSLRGGRRPPKSIRCTHFCRSPGRRLPGVSMETGGGGRERRARGTWLLIGQKDRDAVGRFERRMRSNIPDTKNMEIF